MNRMVKYNGKHINLDSLNFEELQQLNIDLMTEVDKIKRDLDLAEVERLEIGRYARPEWIAKAAFAKRRITRSVQLVQTELGKRKKVRVASLEKQFMIVCEERLLPQVFQEYLNDARDRCALDALERGRSN